MSMASDILYAIFEMGFSRSKMEDKVSGLAEPVNLHLIKILKWEDEINYKKHVKNINSWLFSIPLNTNFRLKHRDLYKWLFLEYLKSVKTVTRAIKFGLTDYHDLKVIRSDDEVYLIIKDILDKVCNDIVHDDFDGIEKYLP